MVKKTIAAITLLVLLLAVLISINSLTVLGESKTADLQGEEAYAETSVDEQAAEVPYSRGRVVKVIEEVDRSIGDEEIGIIAPTQVVDVLIVKGPHKGETVRADYSLTYNFNSDYKLDPLRVGDEVLLYIEENDDGTIATVSVAEFARDKYLLYLVLGFILTLVIIGKGSGMKAVISLALTALAVVKIMIPAILAGRNPVTVSVAVCAGVIGITMLIISGPNKKTLSSIIGTVGGVIVAGIVAMLVGSIARLTGLGGDETQMLMYIPQSIHFDFRGLLFAGILIGTMGANMDVGISIASAMDEIKANNPQIKPVDLMKAGMNVGRDIMATMSNTLILAYAGSSLPLMLLLMAYNTPFSHVINWDVIASEVMRAIAGSIGLVFTIPITAFAAIYIERRRGESIPKLSKMVNQIKSGISIGRDEANNQYKTAIFAGGCFWYMVSPFDVLDGVIEVKSGYTGGHKKNPTYNDVKSQKSGHYEAIKIIYDPEIVSYDKLLQAYWRQVDPTDEGGQFGDRGESYRTAIFYMDEEQRQIAEASKKVMDESGRFPGPIVTPILRAAKFYDAEHYYQDFYKKSPEEYAEDRATSGRDEFINKYWGDEY